MEEENKELNKELTEAEEMEQATKILAKSGMTLEEAAEKINKIAETIIETLKPVVERTIDVAKKFYEEIVKAYSVDPEVKKCYGIYKRTKNRRIRKKQMTRINKIIDRRYIKNG